MIKGIDIVYGQNWVQQYFDARIGIFADINERRTRNKSAKQIIWDCEWGVNAIWARRHSYMALNRGKIIRIR